MIVHTSYTISFSVNHCLSPERQTSLKTGEVIPVSLDSPFSCGASLGPVSGGQHSKPEDRHGTDERQTRTDSWKCVEYQYHFYNSPDVHSFVPIHELSTYFDYICQPS